MDDIGDIQLRIRADFKELTGLLKTTDQTKRAIGLLAKDFARTGDKSQYMSSINKIVMAQNNLSKTSRMSQSAIMTLGAKVVQQTKYTDSLTVATRRLNAAQMASGKVMGNTRNKMNGNNMAIQQLGYQFGDFAVQVQGGTSAFVAFSQQGSQLAGILPMIAGPLGLSMGAAVGLSAALGILIPIGSAVGRMFMETRKAAKGAAEGIISIKDASKEAVKEISKLRGELELLQSGASGSQELALNKAIFEMYNKIYDLKNKTVDLSHADAETIKTVESAIAGASTASQEQLKVYEDQLASLLRQRDAIIVNKALVGSEVNEADNEQANTRRRIRADVERGKELTKQSNQRQQNVLEGIAIFRAANNKADAERILAEENRQKTVLEGIAIFRAANERIEDERLAVQERIQQNQLEDTKYFYDYKAKREAEDLAMATRVAEIKEELRQKEFAGMQGRRGARGPSAIEIAEMGMGPQITDAQSKLEAQEKLNKKQDEYLATLRLSTQEQLMTAGLKDRELLVAEQFNETYKTQLELDKLGIEYGSAKYERALETLKTQQESILYVYDMIEAEKKLTEEKEKQGQLIDTIGGIIGDGFISMVEGTESVKDAFKSMARAIIKELYQILVVQQMVNAAKAAFGIPVPNANGNVFSSGSIQPYADGGVVGSPTTFPMSGGRTGLMGEAGPEAIMPLKRGANGKLGVQMEGGGATTVVQNFNFSANGDDSVKRIIAQAAPKIAQMTKSEILNDRRRGGTMKATFG